MRRPDDLGPELARLQLTERHSLTFALFVRAGLRRANFDAAEGHLVAVVLKVDLALFHGAELFPLLELALANPAVPVIAAELELDDLLAVEPVFGLAAVDDDPRLVPLA